MKAAMFLPEAVPLLLSAGADVNKANRYGVTPLHAASEYHRPEAVKALIKAGADANATTVEIGSRDAAYRLTPLHMAASSLESVEAKLDFDEAKLMDTVRALVMAGADVNATDSLGRTAADLLPSVPKFDEAAMIRAEPHFADHIRRKAAERRSERRQIEWIADRLKSLPKGKRAAVGELVTSKAGIPKGVRKMITGYAMKGGRRSRRRRRSRRSSRRRRSKRSRRRSTRRRKRSTRKAVSSFNPQTKALYTKVAVLIKTS
jgi:ankyrin repeat protein